MENFEPSDYMLFDLELASTLNMTPASGAASFGQPATRAPEASAPLLAYAMFPGMAPPSPAFGPTFQANGVLPDVVLLSADNIPFYAHRRVLHYSSTNAFGSLLPFIHESISLPETSAILSIVLHVLYGLSFFHPADTTLETVDSAIDVMKKYGIEVDKYAAPHWPLFQLVTSHIPHRPIDAYALAAHHGLEQLAVTASAHLLAYDLSTLTDELTVRMGPIYTKRLFDLHQTRRSALKDIVLKPPAMHPLNLVCGSEQQRQLTLAWALAAADMAWTATPSMSTHMLQRTFERAGRDISCVECRVMLTTRIREAMAEWSAVQTTI